MRNWLGVGLWPVMCAGFFSATLRRNAPGQQYDVPGASACVIGQSVSLRELRELAAAARSGALVVTPEVEAQIEDAVTTLRELKMLLMTALGIKER